jgi:hypothetical protein
LSASKIELLSRPIVVFWWQFAPRRLWCNVDHGLISTPVAGTLLSLGAINSNLKQFCNIRVAKEGIHNPTAGEYWGRKL